jgi:hypothetical protein
MLLATISFEAYSSTKAGRAARASEDTTESQGGWEVPRLLLPPPIENHLIHLLAQGLHVGIGKASVQRAHAIGVVARAADGAVELGLADLAGRALGTLASVAAVASIAAIIAAWDAELEAHVAAVEARLHRRLLTGIERRHAIDHGLGKGWTLGSLRPWAWPA